MKTVGESVVLQAFGLSVEGEENVIGKTSTLTGVRASGEAFTLSITITKINNDVYTCKLAENSESSGTEEQVAESIHARSSSSFSSYADTFSSRKNSGRFTLSSFGNSYSTIGSNFGGVVVDMNERGVDDDSEWVGISRYAAGVEEVYGDVRLNRIHH